MAFSPTKEQALAINENGSIIVSAAAGSGKTAVLVERVMRLLTDEKSPVMADKLLVVTFTNAAAAELRQRIERRIQEEIKANPDNILLQKQSLLLSGAKISTIDSFCLDFMRENFEVIGINPSFKIADTPTINSLSKTALSQVIGGYFESKDKEFLSLLDFLGDDYDDSILQKTVTSVFDFSRHLPFPKLWLSEILNQYKAHSTGESDLWINGVLDVAKELAEDAYIQSSRALNLLSTSDAALEKYGANFTYFKEISAAVFEVANEGKWDEIFSILKDIKAPAVKRLSSDEKTSKIEEAVTYRDSAKKLIAKISSVVYAQKEDIIKEFVYIYPYIFKIIEIVNKYEDAFYSLLNENDLVTFYSAEQTVLDMLVKVENGKLVACDNIDVFSGKFDAILVDEYQDTNTLQDTLFTVLSGGGKNLFCVGDIKQCIYKFRGSNPLNFLHKKSSAKPIDSRNENDMLRIDLGCNFRSRSEICDFINSVFTKLIYTENSGFDYDKDEELVANAEFPLNNDIKVENHFLKFDEILNNSENAFKTKLEAEACAVADIIESVINKEPFLRDKNSLRKAKYSDIAILVRSMRGKDEAFIGALKKRGIPVSVSAADILESDEVNTLISFLKIISNPSDDIALLTVLTSPVVSFSVNELAEIRAEHKRGNFYSALSFAAKNGNKKATEFISLLGVLRRRSIVVSLDVLIEEIFEETNLLNLYSKNENGDIKRSNLLCIQNLAADYGAVNSQDIQGFLQYFINMENRDFSFSNDSSDGVKIMSIHKSKGLQFPVCILANLTNKFNEQDLRDSVILSENRGISCVYYNENGEKQDNNILRTLMRHEEKKSLLSEELRIFYVALTRAEEKLITVSTYDNFNEELTQKNHMLELTNSKPRIEYSLFRKNVSYADWLIESLILDGKFDALIGKINDSQIVIHNKLKVDEPLINQNSVNTDDMNSANIDDLKLYYSYEYPYKELLDLQAKSSVTDIVHKADEKNYRFSARPVFMQSKGLSSAERGTAMHKVMQMADYVRCKTDLEAVLEELYENLVLSETEFNSLDIDLFKTFFSSELCDRIIRSDFVKREMKFLTEFKAGELLEDISEKSKNEEIIVQGAVDLLFAEDGGIVIVDFKSDRNKNENELINAYEKQLIIYAKACEKLLKMPVKELLIYSYSLGKTIKIK